VAVPREVDEDLEQSVPVGANAWKILRNPALNRNAGVRLRRVHKHAKVVEDSGELYGSDVVFGRRSQLERSKSLQGLHQHTERPEIGVIFQSGYRRQVFSYNRDGRANVPHLMRYPGNKDARVLQQMIQAELLAIPEVL
jgi:hypothetical protein